MGYELNQKGYFDKGSNFYNNQVVIETAELTRRILLPVLPPHTPSFYTLKAYNDLGYTFRTAEIVYTDYLGNFDLNINTPLVDKEIPNTTVEHEPPQLTIVNEVEGEPEPYKTSNFLQLFIPKYIVCNFRGEIPAGTKFLVSYIGSSQQVGNMKIIGVAEYGENKMTLAHEPLINYVLADENSYGAGFIRAVKEDIDAANEEFVEAFKEEFLLAGGEEATNPYELNDLPDPGKEMEEYLIGAEDPELFGGKGGEEGGRNVSEAVAEELSKSSKLTEGNSSRSSTGDSVKSTSAARATVHVFGGGREVM